MFSVAAYVDIFIITRFKQKAITEWRQTETQRKQTKTNTNHTAKYALEAQANESTQTNSTSNDYCQLASSSLLSLVYACVCACLWRDNQYRLVATFLALSHSNSISLTHWYAPYWNCVRHKGGACARWWLCRDEGAAEANANGGGAPSTNRPRAILRGQGDGKTQPTKYLILYVMCLRGDGLLVVGLYSFGLFVCHRTQWEQ